MQRRWASLHPHEWLPNTPPGWLSSALKKRGTPPPSPRLLDKTLNPHRGTSGNPRSLRSAQIPSKRCLCWVCTLSARHTCCSGGVNHRRGTLDSPHAGLAAAGLGASQLALTHPHVILHLHTPPRHVGTDQATTRFLLNDSFPGEVHGRKEKGTRRCFSHSWSRVLSPLHPGGSHLLATNSEEGVS